MILHSHYVRRAHRVLLAGTVAALAIPAIPLTGQDTPGGTALSALLAEADSANPEIVAARKAAEAALAHVPQAGALPDPTLGIGLMNVPVAEPSLSGTMMTMAQVQVGARLPWPGKLSLREAGARLGAEAAALDVEEVRQKVRAEVKTSYYEVHFLDRAVEVTTRNEALLGDLTRVTTALYAVGGSAQPDVLKAQVQRAGLADQLVVLRQRRTTEVARLNAMLGRPPETPLTPIGMPEAVRRAAVAEGASAGQFTSAALGSVVPGGGESDGWLPGSADLSRLAMQHNPAILADVRRVEAAERALALSEKAKLPDLSVSVAYARRGGFGDLFSISVSAPLPIFGARKQDQAVAEQAAAVATLEARHTALVNGVDARITSLEAELRRAREEITLLDQGILPQATATLASATASYQVGRVDFLTLLDAQATLYRHQLDYHRLLADFAKNMAALERAVGTEVLR